jgi:hypothetical protein
MDFMDFQSALSGKLLRPSGYALALGRVYHQYTATRNSPWCRKLISACYSQRASTPSNDTFLTPPSLSRRNLNITYPPSKSSPITAIQFLRTPWPILAGQTAVSLYLVSHSFGKDQSEPSNFKKFVFGINFIRGAVAVVYQILDLAEHTRVMPSVGVMIVFLGLLISSYTFWTIVPLISRAGVFICAIGMVLYVINGLLASLTTGPGDMSVEFIIDIGCLGGYNKKYKTCPTVEPMQAVYEKTLGDWCYQISWATGAFLVFLIVGVNSLRSCLRKVELVYLRPLVIRCTSLLVTGLGGVIALTGGIIGSSGWSTTVIDCSRATQMSGYYSGCVSVTASVPGDSWGFWNTWVEYKAAVARSIFTW